MANLYQVACGVWITRELALEIARSSREQHERSIHAEWVTFENVCVEGITLCIDLGDGNEEAENLCFILWSDDDYRLRFLEMLRELGWKGQKIVELFREHENNFSAVRYAINLAYGMSTTMPTG